VYQFFSGKKSSPVSFGQKGGHSSGKSSAQYGHSSIILFNTKQINTTNDPSRPILTGLEKGRF